VRSLITSHASSARIILRDTRPRPTFIPAENAVTSITAGAKPAWFSEIYRAALGADPASDGKVPVLQDGAFVITESAVVADYVAAKAGGALLPATPEARARAAIFAEQGVSKFVGAFYPLLRSSPEERAEKTAAFLAAVAATGAALGASGGPFFAGAAVSLADFLLWPFVERVCVLEHYASLALPREGAGFVAFAAWSDAMRALPSVVATRQEPAFFIDGYKGYAHAAK
jgi:glutathione S-transferase